MKNNIQTTKLTSKKRNIKKRPAPYYDQYRDLFTMRMKPVPESFIDRISGELVWWAKNDPDALILKDFFYEKGIGTRTIRRWAQKHELLKEAMEEAKFLIGSRREKGAIKREYDSNMIKSVMINYDPEWKESEEWRSALRQKENRVGTINLVVPKLPETDIVPKRISDENLEARDASVRD